MQTDNRLLDDLAKVASGALGTLQGVKSEVTARLRDQVERVLANLDLVTREEFDAVKAMAAAARSENEAMAARLEALEAPEAQRTGTRPRRAASASTKAASTAATAAKTAKTAKTKAKPAKTAKTKAKPAKAASAKAKPTKGTAGSGATARRPKA